MTKIQGLKEELRNMMVPLDTYNLNSAPIHVLTAALKSLATQEDFDKVINLYNESFAMPMLDEPLQDQVKTINVSLSLTSNGGDPGVELECKKSPQELALLLAFPNGNPLLFNLYRHCGRLTSWIERSKADALFSPAAKRNPDMVPLLLHWHQLAGISAIA
ncbi:hypothetical protein H0H87_009984 [Tephrocybe sp. NHM501043]|nr:hypothetical protein H0H87_009984 [Tephrocybe sp. NHM501043]